MFADDPLKVHATFHRGHAALSSIRLGAGVVDPRTKGTCPACHDPHGAPLEKIITFPKEGALCIQCHNGEMLRTRQ